MPRHIQTGPTLRTTTEIYATAVIGQWQREERLMHGRYKVLWDRVGSNARRAVDVYLSELPDFRAAAKNPSARASMLGLRGATQRRNPQPLAGFQPS